ncbi:F-box/WD repeat-containing protein 12 [Tachyglossus aculeatus]|uniref:F-box/WD repeat-containing protein 12 n=1 Tax=Tachyglossus aculeatus TaxID=9261 RepID=UPI0018F68405|nr:F-box/WD repeat-containing protein 12 [Tachyglossus aculeatus]
MGSLSLDGLLHVFSFLEAPDLLRAAQVDKFWNAAADSTVLWRKLCLERWVFCNVSHSSFETFTWKEYYLHRSQLEHKMASGRPSSDYISKAIRGFKGEIISMAYLTAYEYSFQKQERSIICTLGSDGLIQAWDIHEGEEIWSRRVPDLPPQSLVTLPRFQLVITTHVKGTIKVWNGETGAEQASFSTQSSSCTLATYMANDSPFLTAATAGGTLYTLTVPHLNEVSRVTASQSSNVNLLLCSTNMKWIVTGSIVNLDSPTKVFHTDSLTSPCEDNLPLSTCLPIMNCAAASWAPSEEARITIMHGDGWAGHMSITTFDIITKKSKYKMEIQAHEVASCMLPETTARSSLLKSHGADMILLGTGCELKLFSIFGTQLAVFQDHQRTISSIWVDPFRVITASWDLSLRVYMWKREGNITVLKSCYHLLGGSHRWARGFTDVTCDGVSIVGALAGRDGADFLRAYTFSL